MPFLSTLTPVSDRIYIEAAAYPDANATPPSDVEAVASEWARCFTSILSHGDDASLSQVFLREFYMRDHLVLTWDLRTFKHLSVLAAQLKRKSKHSGLLSVAVDKAASRKPQTSYIDSDKKVVCVDAFLTLKTAAGTGRGFVKLAKDLTDGTWKVYTLYTVLTSLDSSPETIGLNRPLGLEYDPRRTGKTWAEERREQQNFQGTEQPIVLIVGAGQAGLATAAHLERLGVRTLIVERLPNVGDNWANRYRSLILHDPVWYNHMPYLPFPKNWPVFTPKDKIANWMDFYAQVMELNVWTSTTLTGAVWSDSTCSWTVTLETMTSDGSMLKRTLTPNHIVQATGQAGVPNIPSIPGAHLFQGPPIIHSSQFRGAPSGSAGKRVVIVGSSNSAHDIAQDYYHAGYHVTMIQRSPTCVDPSRYFKGKGQYVEGGPETEYADLVNYSVPLPVLKRNAIESTKKMKVDHCKFFEGLEKAGFRLNWGEDESGRALMFQSRGGGYYINIGCSELIIAGAIKIQSGSSVSEITASGLMLSDGTALPADEIVFATGYKSMKESARKMFGDAVAERVGEVWGLDEEGELRGVWRESGHPGFWFAAGNLALCRYYSKLLALRIKASEEGLVG